MNIKEEILRLKDEQDAIILSHTYQIPEVQDIADVVGDSLALARVAKETDKSTIILCGVKFMAETAKILSENKRVIIANADAGCPMADMVTKEDVIRAKGKHPDGLVVSYVNSSAEVKSVSDVCVTSSNAVSIIKQLDAEKILFFPDKNLGNYLKKQVPEKEFIIHPGFCITHERVEPMEIFAIRKRKPGQQICAHPECNPQVVSMADFVGSTQQIIDYITASDEKKFIIGTEMGILHGLRKKNPDKHFTLLSASLVCHNMKKTSLDDIYRVLSTGSNEISIDTEVLEGAKISLDKMMELS